jgi:hypothetical protein
VPARELLNWTICEPALGSGAFLNEAINQVAAKYLQLAQEEAKKDGRETIPPEAYDTELRKAKAYIALHNSYGVDLNPTAVELAEVSLWLNVMHPGLQAPWFGLHLRRGNSLVGAGRRCYPGPQLTDGGWLRPKDALPPTDHPFRSGKLPDGAVHHFLLPAVGWAAVAGEKEARELAPEDTKRLATWRRAMLRKPTAKQAQRLQALAGRVEYLWSLVIRRLEISQREISRHIDVWGARDLPHPAETVSRQKVYDDLHAPGTPYWRLRTLMDTWCALWFWPAHRASLLDGSAPDYPPAADMAAPSAAAPAAAVVHDTLDGGDATAVRTGPRRQMGVRRPVQRPFVALANLDDWIEFAEALLGRADVTDGTIGTEATTLSELDELEDQLPVWMLSEQPHRLPVRFPWLTAADEITQEQGFFHWELDFAHVFASDAAGFDLQLGNPPWVRPRWRRDLVLAELEPWFALAENPPVEEWRHRKDILLQDDVVRVYFMGEMAINAGIVQMLSSEADYLLLAGTQPDTYRAFMIRVWGHLGTSGTAGLLHPDTHFGGLNEARLREAAYHRLRVHGSYVNVGNWAFDRGRTVDFGLHIYGPAREIRFQHLSQLFGGDVLPASLAHDGTGPPPRQKVDSKWDVRPHKSRVIEVTEDLLGEWRRLDGESGLPVSQTPLLYPITIYEQGAISALASFPRRLGGENPWISPGYHEKAGKEKGLIRWAPQQPPSLDEVILQARHFSTANAFAKQPNDPFSYDKDWVFWDLRTLPKSAVPRATYARACDKDRYIAAQDKWDGHRYTEHYRLAWRVMVDPKNTERSLFAALIPPGPAHVHLVQSMAVASNRDTALSAGFWAALPLDYLLRVTGRAHLQVTEARRMPAPDPSHPLANALLLRTLRLNCLTDAYASLWSELVDPGWAAQENWAIDWPRIEPIGAISKAWTYDTPLRTDYARRAALVELDALVALWLGIDAEELIAVYQARYPILADREDAMFFDATGRRIAADSYAFGFGQTKEDYKRLVAHLDNGAAPPEGYEPPFYKADREREMREAHAVFAKRLAGGGDA